MKSHPAHRPNGVAYIRRLTDKGRPAGYVSETGKYWVESGLLSLFRPLRFGSFKEAEAFLHANPQWQPARVESIDPLSPAGTDERRTTKE